MLTVLKPTPHSTQAEPPPEKLSAYLKLSVAGLKARSEQGDVTQLPERNLTGSSIRYRRCVEMWLKSLTPTQQERKYTADEVVKLAGVSGHEGKQASIQRVTQALRECGFEQVRDWTKAGRNRRYWIYKKRG